MQEALRRVFKRFGTIKEIIVKGSLKRKGQAFVVFDNQESALEAINIMDEFPMYGKSMKLQLAKTHSDATVMDKASNMYEEHKRKRQTLKGTEPPCTSQRTNCVLTHKADMKRAKEDADRTVNPAAAEKPRALKPGVSAIPDEYVRPNKVLFLQNLPKDCDEEQLTSIFERYAGFKEMRYLAIKSIAFATFENEQSAIVAKEATLNMPIGGEGRPMKVTYQRE